MNKKIISYGVPLFSALIGLSFANGERGMSLQEKIDSSRERIASIEEKLSSSKERLNALEQELVQSQVIDKELSSSDFVQEEIPNIEVSIEEDGIIEDSVPLLDESAFSKGYSFSTESVPSLQEEMEPYVIADMNGEKAMDTTSEPKSGWKEKSLRNAEDNYFAVVAKFSYFYPTSSRFRDIYGDGGINYGFDLDGKIYGPWHLFFGFDYFEKSGHSVGLGDPTCVRIIPLSAGLRYYFWPVNWIAPYLGVGLTYTFLRTEDDSCFVQRKVTDEGFGGVFAVGSRFFFFRHLVIDIFADYQYTQFPARFSQNPTIQTECVDLSGLRVGGAIGFSY